MRRYIKADLHRIYSRISRWILLILMLAVIVFLNLPDGESNATDYLQMMNYILSSMALILGVFEMKYIYGDDFRAKTMQIAIGSGIRREKVVLAKWIEVMIVTAVDLILVDFSAIILPVIMVPNVLSGCVTDMLINTFMTWLSVVVFYAIVMIVLFWTQTTALPLVVYIVLASGVIPSLIKLAGSMLEISRFHLQTYTLNNMISVATARLLLGSVHMASWIGIILYTVVGFVLTNLIFKKLELNF